MSTELPSSWTTVRLEQLLAPLDDGKTLHHGWSPQCEKEPARSDDEWGVLKTTAIQAGSFMPEHNKRLPSNLAPRPQHEVKAGDLLITCAGPRVRCGVPCLVRKTRPRLMLSGKMYRFRTSPDLCEPGYLEKYLLSHAAQHTIDAMKTGGSDSGLNLTHDRFKPLAVPLAPVREQQRIVSRIEELFSEIAEGERALERVGRLVERYRQSVLKAAVTGGADLSSDAWPATAPSLPAGWSWASIGEIAKVSGGLTKNRARAERELLRPFLRVANVHANRLDLTEVHQIGVSPAELPRVSLEKDDLLVVEGNGSIDQIGRVALWDGSIPGCVHQNHLIKVRCTAAVPSWFLLVWLLSPLGRRHIEQVASSSSGLHTLSISKVQSLPVPVPPASLLPGIRDNFDRMEVATAGARAALASERARAAALRQSILKAAFSGRLVPQDPRDEPASALLARLAAQPAPASAARRRSGSLRKSATP